MCSMSVFEFISQRTVNVLLLWTSFQTSFKLSAEKSAVTPTGSNHAAQSPFLCS